MNLPPDLLAANAAFVTSGTANTVTTGTVVAAPGAGLRIRLWAFQANPSLTSQAVVNWRLLYTDGIAGSNIGACSGANMAGPPLSFIPGGKALATNTALGYSVQSALASLQINYGVLYTIEAA